MIALMNSSLVYVSGALESLVVVLKNKYFLIFLSTVKGGVKPVKSRSDDDFVKEHFAAPLANLGGN